MRVFAYWNLHRACWSLKALDGALRGRVVAHCTAFELRGCAFKVSEAGRQRVLREGRKNVHAGVVGALVTFEGVPGARNELAQVANVRLSWPRVDDAEGVPVTYNPRRSATFESADLLREPMHAAPRVVAQGRRVVACGEAA